ncbi:hypothetical protein ACFV94_35195, partial [Streptomyces sp. NPDC059896]
MGLLGADGNSVGNISGRWTIRLHGVWHSSVTLLLEQGIDLVMIKEFLGQPQSGTVTCASTIRAMLPTGTELTVRLQFDRRTTCARSDLRGFLNLFSHQERIRQAGEMKILSRTDLVMVQSNNGTLRCDMRSLVLSEDVEGGSTEVEDVVRAVSVACP